MNSRRGDSRRHDFLWWCHVNRCRAMIGNWSELGPARKSRRCHVNTPFLHHVLETSRGKLRSGASHTLKRRDGVTEIQLRHNREPMQFFQRRNNVVRFFWKYRSSGQWLVIEPKFSTTWSLRRLVSARGQVFSVATDLPPAPE